MRRDKINSRDDVVDVSSIHVVPERHPDKAGADQLVLRKQLGLEHRSGLVRDPEQRVPVPEGLVVGAEGARY